MQSMYTAEYFLKALKWLLEHPLREMCPNTEFSLVCIFPYSDLMRRDSPYSSAFSPNGGKYGPEKTPYLDSFHAMIPLKHLM